MRPFSPLSDPFLVAETEEGFAVFKPAGMHSTAAASLLCWAREHLPLTATGRDIGMLSRLDRDTSGLVFFARNDAMLAYMLAQQEHNLFSKYYRAIVDQVLLDMPGSLPVRNFVRIRPGAEIKSRFRSFGPRGARVACVQDAMRDMTHRPLSPLYCTHIVDLADAAAAHNDSGAAVASLRLDIAIQRGFRHQIRAHLAWSLWPIRGDSLYGGLGADRLYLESYNIKYQGSAGNFVDISLY